MAIARAAATAMVAMACACGNPAGDAHSGREVFLKVCKDCHGEYGKPDPTKIATLGVRDLTALEFRKRVDAQLVENQVRRGSKNRVMPSFEGLLTEEQIKAVAVYVANDRFPQSE